MLLRYVIALYVISLLIALRYCIRLFGKLLRYVISPPHAVRYTLWYVTLLILVRYVISRCVATDRLCHLALQVPLHYVTSRYDMLRCIPLGCVALRPVIPRYVTLCQVSLVYVTPRCVKLNYVTMHALRYVTLRRETRQNQYLGAAPKRWPFGVFLCKPTETDRHMYTYINIYMYIHIYPSTYMYIDSTHA